MLEYGDFCYLDLQKTGSTFVRRFLKKHVVIPIVADLKHGRFREPIQLSEGKIFFHNLPGAVGAMEEPLYVWQ